MSLLIFAYRKQDIIRRKSDLNFKLLQIKAKLFDLHDYAGNIADGSVSLNDLMKCPPSLFNRMTSFMMYSHQASEAGAKQKYWMMQNTQGAIPQMPDANQQNQMNQMVYNNLYEKQREEFKKIEEKALNEQNKKLDQESAKVEEQLKMLDEELKQVSEATDAAAKSSAPKYVA